MASGWRIQRAQYGADAFSGEGGRRSQGRWNSRGVPVVYLSEHQSMAALEIFVRTRPLVSSHKYVVIGASWDNALMETWPVNKLPADWRASPVAAHTVVIGDGWLREMRSAVLAVPSAIIPTEANYLLNPQHPDFRRIKLGKPMPFTFDQRLVGR